MSGHDDEAEYGIPFWAYSDDEDLTDVRSDLTASFWDEPASGPSGLDLSDDEGAEVGLRGWWAGSVAAESASHDSVQKLLDLPRLSWAGCREAVEIASALGAWDLVERAALRAMRIAHDGDYGPSPTLGLVARQVLVAKCAEAALTDLAAALADGQARLRAVLDDARREGRTAVADAVDGEVRLASKMLLLLGSPDDASALASLAGGLRRVGRPDLAEETATRAIELQPDHKAPWVVRAAARADRRNHRGALTDLDQELLNNDIPAAVTKIRVLRSIGRLPQALALALTTAQADPSKYALTMLRLLAAQTGDDAARAVAERLFGETGDSPDRPSSRLLGLLAAEQLSRDGDHDNALLLAEVVAADGPPWQRAETLLQKLRRAAALQPGATVVVGRRQAAPRHPPDALA